MVFPFPSYATDWLEVRYMHVSNSLLILFYHNIPYCCTNVDELVTAAQINSNFFAEIP